MWIQYEAQMGSVFLLLHSNKSSAEDLQGVSAF